MKHKEQTLLFSYFLGINPYINVGICRFYQNQVFLFGTTPRHKTHFIQIYISMYYDQFFNPKICIIC